MSNKRQVIPLVFSLLVFSGIVLSAVYGDECNNLITNSVEMQVVDGTGPTLVNCDDGQPPATKVCPFVSKEVLPSHNLPCYDASAHEYIGKCCKEGVVIWELYKVYCIIVENVKYCLYDVKDESASMPEEPAGIIDDCIADVCPGT